VLLNHAPQLVSKTVERKAIRGKQEKSTGFRLHQVLSVLWEDWNNGRQKAAIQQPPFVISAFLRRSGDGHPEDTADAEGTEEKAEGKETGKSVTFDFRTKVGERCDASAWIDEWEREYPSNQYDEKYYGVLIEKAGSLSSADFIIMGRWKDDAWTEGRWRPNVASVAFPAWIAASAELPGFVIDRSTLERFLTSWADRLYPDTASRSADRMKRFGLSRTTTMAHFISAGMFPICDKRVRTAIKRLCSIRTPDEIGWYLQSYIPIFEELRMLCRVSGRKLDKALFAYGGN
jgi:hypothetical protein